MHCKKKKLQRPCQQFRSLSTMFLYDYLHFKRTFSKSSAVNLSREILVIKSLYVRKENSSSHFQDQSQSTVVIVNKPSNTFYPFNKGQDFWTDQNSNICRRQIKRYQTARDFFLLKKTENIVGKKKEENVGKPAFSSFFPPQCF